MKKIVTLTACILLSAFLMANDITVSNAGISGQNTTAKTTVINFDVAWENSWRTSTNENNYDAAWIFVKYRKNGTTDWRHATINTAGFTPGAGAAITVSADGKGVFFYRNANGIGNISFTANQLVWNYGTDGLLDNETVEIKVFALEMVYIPQGTFMLGSGGTDVNGYKTGATSTPYNVTATAITFGTSGINLNTNGKGPTTGTLPSSFPTGFNAFWVMKYETSEQQYVDFLNHLDQARATAIGNSSGFTGTHPNLVAPAPERAFAYMNTARLAAISDWSGLRPMSEMEFEKVCRGYNTPAVPNEYAWGTTSIYPVTSVTNAGLTNEMAAMPTNANANIANNYGLFTRVGIYARPAAATRELSGATYYGVMNMSDNVYEICTTTVDPAGLAFDGSIHGDGYLAASGNSNQANWTTYGAYGWRGANYATSLIFARVSDRANISIYTTTYGSDALVLGTGGRMARTAQ